MALYNQFGATLGGRSPFDPENLLPVGLDVDQTATHTGMNFDIEETPALMMPPDGLLRVIPGKKVLFRADTMAPLATVSNQYNVVQPREMLGFYKDLLDTAGYEMAAGGVLKGGCRFWAMARTGSEGGLKDDPIVGYLFLGSAVDGSLSTTGFFTNQLMACWNQSPAILRIAQENKTFIRVPHSREFKPEDVQAELGQGAAAFGNFLSSAQQLSERKITSDEALKYFIKVFKPQDIEDAVLVTPEEEESNLIDGSNAKRVKAALELFHGTGRGMNLAVRNGTAWGAYNCVTEFLDHHAGARSAENRFHSAVLGQGFRIKERAMAEALKLAA
jgi:phage/plasmid-like protein (TIGR03299 family)